MNGNLIAVNGILTDNIIMNDEVLTMNKAYNTIDRLQLRLIELEKDIDKHQDNIVDTIQWDIDLIDLLRCRDNLIDKIETLDSQYCKLD